MAGTRVTIAARSLLPPFPPTLPGVLARAVARDPDRDFLVCGPERLTYHDADEASARLARGLLALGVGKGTRVGLIMPNSPDWVVCFLAAARIGALTVPISTFYQGPELRWVLEHSDVHTLLTVDRFLNHDYVERLRGVLAVTPEPDHALFVDAIPHLRHIVTWGETTLPGAKRGPDDLFRLADANPRLDRAFLAAVEATVAPADDLMVVYTSGSTLEPKAVVHTHSSAISLSYALQSSGWSDIRAGDRVYSTAPFFWIGGHSSYLMPCMFTNACVVMAPSPDVDDVIDTLCREQVTTVLATTAVLADVEDRAARRGITLPALRLRTHQHDDAGEPIPPDLVPNTIGMTETFGPHGVEPLGTRLPRDKAGAFARSIPGVERKIVDPVTGQECAPGEPGELYVRGFSLMRGFYKRLREETFDADGFYPTGDRCRIDADGYLYFEGRYGDMIKTSGANVSCREVEAVLERCAEVREAAVFGVPDPVRGEAVVAVVVPTTGTDIDENELLPQLRKQLSHFKVPHHVFAIEFHEIPRTHTGKISKRELRSLVLDRWDHLSVGGVRDSQPSR